MYTPEELSEIRTSLALNRSFLSTERTFLSWLRTGLAIVGAGVTVAEALKNGVNGDISFLIGKILLGLGIFTFIYGWWEYYRAFHYIRSIYQEDLRPQEKFRFNFISGTILIVILVLVSVLAFFLIAR